MRQQNIVGDSDSYRLVFPDIEAFKFDNNFIRVESVGSNPVGARITVRNGNTNKMKVLRYMSELSSVTFDLNNVFLELWSEDYTFNSFYIQIAPLFNNSIDYGAIYNFILNLNNGKTLPYRSHTSERVIYLFDDMLANFQIYLNNSGSLSVNGIDFDVTRGHNILDITNAVGNSTTFKGCYDFVNTGTLTTTINSASNITTNSATLNIEFKTGSDNRVEPIITSGDIWKDKTSFYSNPEKFCFDFERIEVCNDFDSFLLAYTNTDGCERMAAGKIIREIKESSSTNIYNRNTTIYNYSHRHITERKVKLLVGFDDISKYSSFTDIEFSPRLYFKNYQGGWVECSLLTLSITEESDEFLSYELEIEILN